MSREDVAGLIADAARLDRHTVQLRLGKAPPTILGLFPRTVADLAIVAMQRRGGDGFAVAMSDLESLGPTLKIRDLRLADGVILAELWRGPAVKIKPQEIQVLVRARMSERQPAAIPTSLEASHLMRWSPPGRLAPLAWSNVGAFGLAAGLGYAYEFGDAAERVGQSETRLSHKLDLHTNNGKVYQIDGDKFGFKVLGELRGHSDNQNIDAMCELFVTLNREAIVDPYFSLWSPPVGYERLRLPMMKVNNEDPAFAFYSRWTTLMYRHIIKRAAKPTT